MYWGGGQEGELGHEKGRWGTVRNRMMGNRNRKRRWGRVINMMMGKDRRGIGRGDWRLN